MNLQDQLAQGKEKVAFRVSFSNEYGSVSHIQLDLVYVGENDQICFYDNFYGQKHQYKSLCVKSQLDEHFMEPYGWELVKECSSGMNLTEAREVVKTLSVIEKKMEKLSVQHGQPTSFDQYVTRLARVLNVKAFYVSHKNSKNVYHEDRADLVPIIRRLVDYHKTHVVRAA